ncbi:MAG TPA: SHOCT domain-containing protein [Allosphingosinicella sp.]|nr:SHOCT domain-containing protein [Allosphingosinicella sp.]
MSSRYDELERLQRLRESGALTDEEFQAEKRRLLGHETIAPAAEEPADGAEPPQSRLPIYLLIGGAALLVAIVAGLWLGNLVGGGGSYENGNAALPAENAAADVNLVEAKALPDVRSLPADEQLARAFEAAFGSRGEAVLTVQSDGASEAVRYAPGRLVWTGFGPVLVSEGKVQDPAHVSAGKIAIHYLRPAADRFEVARAFPAAVATGSFGQVARWSLSPRFSTWPVIVAEGGGTWQGHSCSWLTLTELAPGGPVELARVPLTYDDKGASEDESEAKSIEGRILNVVRNQSFDVVYSGSRAFSEHWVRSGNRYAVAGGESAMETC